MILLDLRLDKFINECFSKFLTMTFQSFAHMSTHVVGRRGYKNKSLRRSGQTHDLGCQKARRARLEREQRYRAYYARNSIGTRNGHSNGASYSTSFLDAYAYLGINDFPLELGRYAGALVDASRVGTGTYRMLDGPEYSFRIGSVGHSGLVQIVGVNIKTRTFATRPVSSGVVRYKLEAALE